MLGLVDLGQDGVLSNKYDQEGLRTVKQIARTIISTTGEEVTEINKTIYPSSLYEEKWFGLEEEPWNWHSQKFRHITLGNQTIAHLNYYDWSSEPNISLVFSDHLGSASILADSFGRLKTLYDYYPFGSLRQEVESGGHLTAQRYTGQELDEELDLYNYGARFYSADNGKFIQSDPVSLRISSSSELSNGSNKNQFDMLSNPQYLNSYSYSGNNPIVYLDPNGELLDFFVDIAFTLYDLGTIFYQFAITGSVDTSEWTNFGLDAASIFMPGVVGLGMVKRATTKAAQVGTKIYTKASEIKNIIKSADKAFDVAKQGGKHSGDYKNFLNRTDQELTDSITSHMKNVEEHIDKLTNPEQYINDFSNKTEQQIQGQIKQWKDHLFRNQEQANIKSGILRERVDQELKN